MQGIATLDPRMNQPPAPMQGVENLPPEIANQANTVFGGMGPEQEAQFQQLAQELNQLLPEELQALLDVLEYLRQNKNRYQEAVQELIAQGRLTSGDVPEQYEPVFFSVEHLLHNPTLAFQSTKTRKEVFVFSINSGKSYCWVLKKPKINVKSDDSKEKHVEALEQKVFIYARKMNDNFALKCYK